MREFHTWVIAWGIPSPVVPTINYPMDPKHGAARVSLGEGNASDGKTMTFRRSIYPWNVGAWASRFSKCGSSSWSCHNNTQQLESLPKARVTWPNGVASPTNYGNHPRLRGWGLPDGWSSDLCSRTYPTSLRWSPSHPASERGNRLT